MSALPPKSGHRADMPACPLSANSVLTRRSKTYWLPRRAGQGWYIPTDGNRAAAPIARRGKRHAAA